MTDLLARIVAEGGCYTLSGGWVTAAVPHQAIVIFTRPDGGLRKGQGHHATDPLAALTAAYQDAREALTL